MNAFQRWGIAVGFIIALAAPQTSGPVQAYSHAVSDLPADIQPMVQLINERRQAAGVAPLIEHHLLSACADQYSETLAALGYLSHTGPDGSRAGDRLRRCGYNWLHYGENLAAGQHDAAEAVAAWMASPPHRRIMLSPRYTEIGVGYTFRDGDPALFVEYYVLEFGTQK